MTSEPVRLFEALGGGDSPIVFDVRHFPIVYIAYPRAFTHEHWADMIRKFDVMLDYRQPFGWINDARTVHLPSARDRAALAAQHKARAEDYRAYAKGASTVSKSAIVRGIVRAIEWINPAPFPHVCADSTTEAELYVRDKLGLPRDLSLLFFTEHDVRVAS